jgi:NAD(P)-dependent dehydrogenase (short-subunit alcohol dehydrogenase family)
MGSLSGSSPYGAAKRGIVGMTKALAVEYAERNVRLNVLSPGLIDTGIWAAIKKAAPTPKDAEDHWKGHIPMNRVGTIEEMGHVAAFLASDEASYVTGSNLLADGGMTSQLIGDEPFEGKNVE